MSDNTPEITEESIQKKLESIKDDFLTEKWTKGTVELIKQIPIIGPSIYAILTSYEHYHENETRKVQIESILELCLQNQERIKSLVEAKDLQKGDLATIIQEFIEISSKTADARKREYVRNAFRNSFDQEKYDEGMTYHFLQILKDLQYPEIHFLVKMVNEGVKSSYSVQYVRDVINKSSILFRLFEKLAEHNLVYDKIQNHYNKDERIVLTQDSIQIYEMGIKFVDFISDKEKDEKNEEDL